MHCLSPDYIKRTTLIVRVTGVLYLIAVIYNLIWVVSNLNTSSFLVLVISLIFLFATILITISGIVLVINNWDFNMVKPIKINKEIEPVVAILIPTYSEPINLIMNTLKSVTRQNWPKDKRIIVISDDGYNEKLENAINKFKKKNNEFSVFYHKPHKKGHPSRVGEAKSGNLNSALQFIIDRFPNIEFIETRDADDLVGSKNFLSYAIKKLLDDTDLSFVQTIKKCKVSNKDPFSNQETIFYHRVMPSRNASNSVFPCGSGLVWRLESLKKINYFPHWNLVEDLHSGYEILRIGGKGVFLPIIGAVGQIAPEDIPNFYKQRGTWTRSVFLM